ncbi:MAG: hypothetical protein P8J86_09050 [Phycisphaerales bacterium]|nr:hypothetical protein [Phycisphaerales bacterium]
MRIVTMSLLLIISFLIVGCNTHTVLGSDIPPIPGMHKVKLNAKYSSSQKGLIGHVHFEGTSHNALDSIDAAVVEFEGQGWAMINVDGSQDEATATLWKEGRDAHLLVKRNPTVPDQSVGALVVEPGPWTPPMTTPSYVAPEATPAPTNETEEADLQSDQEQTISELNEEMQSEQTELPTTDASDESEPQASPTTAPASTPSTGDDADTPPSPDDELMDILDEDPEPDENQ